MMRRTVYFIFFCFFTMYSFAQQDTLFEKGVAALSTGNTDKALDYFQEDVANDPSYEGYYNLSLAYLELKDWKGAFWAAEEALKWNPSSRIAIDNAKKAINNIDSSISWYHPYSWTKRIIIAVPLGFWYSLALISALLVAFFLFTLIIKGKTFRFYNYRYLLLLFGIVFFGSLVNGVIVNHHFTSSGFVYAKEQNQPLYASQNGIVLKQTLELGNRYRILKISEEWVKVKYHDNQPVWVPKTAVFMDQSID